MNHARIARSLCIAAASAACIAQGEVTELSITSTQPFGDFATGRYLRIEAEARGSLAPGEAIPGLDRAARNAAGRVEYSTPVTIVFPEGRGAGNGALLVDVPNRGRAISHGLYNSPRSRPIPVGSLDQGTGFLEERGYSIAVVQWELGEGVQLPTFISGDRKLYAEGVGFAAVRDMAIFLRDAPADRNPPAGSIDRTYAIGYSQTARFLKSFLANGFNESDGKIVFAGLHIINAAGGGMPLLDTGPGPRSVALETPGHLNAEPPRGHEGPFTYAGGVRSGRARHRAWARGIRQNTHNQYP